MRIIKALLKLVVGLAIIIPLGVFALAATVGIFGALLSIAVAAFRLACVALVIVGVFKVAQFLFGSKKRTASPVSSRSLPAPDPYYEAAVREIELEMGHVGRR